MQAFARSLNTGDVSQILGKIMEIIKKIVENKEQTWATIVQPLENVETMNQLVVASKALFDFIRDVRQTDLANQSSQVKINKNYISILLNEEIAEPRYTFVAYALKTDPTDWRVYDVRFDTQMDAIKAMANSGKKKNLLFRFLNNATEDEAQIWANHLRRVLDENHNEV